MKAFKVERVTPYVVRHACLKILPPGPLVAELNKIVDDNIESSRYKFETSRYDDETFLAFKTNFVMTTKRSHLDEFSAERVKNAEIAYREGYIEQSFDELTGWDSDYYTPRVDNSDQFLDYEEMHIRRLLLPYGAFTKVYLNYAFFLSFHIWSPKWVLATGMATHPSITFWSPKLDRPGSRGSGRHQATGVFAGRWRHPALNKQATLNVGRRDRLEPPKLSVFILSFHIWSPKWVLATGMATHTSITFWSPK